MPDKREDFQICEDQQKGNDARDAARSRQYPDEYRADTVNIKKDHQAPG